MASPRDIDSYVVDVEADVTEAEARIKSVFAKAFEAKVDVKLTKTQVKTALKTAATGLSITVDVKFTKAQIKAALLKASTGVSVPVDVKLSKTSFTTLVKDAQGAQKKVTDAVATEQAKQTKLVAVEKAKQDRLVIDSAAKAVTAALANADYLKAVEAEVTAEKQKQAGIRETIAARSGAVETGIAKRVAGEKVIAEDRANARLAILADQHEKRLLQQEAAGAIRRGVINEQLNARLAAQNNQARLKEVAAIAKARAAAQAIADKPIIQDIIVNADRINSSLSGFDRTVTNVLRTTLTAFSLWSGGVVAALAAVGIAAEVEFAKFEAASRRAAATAASSSISDSLARTGTSVKTFAQVAQADLDRINTRATQVSLETVGISATDAAIGIQTLVQSGQTVDEALSNIGIAAKFAQVNGEDLTETTADLAGAMAAAGIGAKDTTKFLNQVQLSSQNAIGGAGDFLKALANGASAAARSYGETNLQAQAFVQLLANTGTIAKTAGTQAAIVFRDFDKVIGQSGDKLQALGIDTSSFETTVTGIAKAFGDVRDQGGNVVEFAKELGFTQRSLNNVLRIVPQLQELGPAGLRRIVSQLKNSTGIIEQQVEFQRKGVAAQFDNLKDTVGKLAREFGEAAAGPVSGFLDLLAGTDGKLNGASKAVQGFGRRFGEVVQKISDFVQTDSFLTGLDTLVEAIKVTVGGVADTFQAFAEAFDEDGKQTRSTFEAVADAVLGFAQVSATVLPAVAKVIGEIVDYLIDHKDSFAFFAKAAVGVYAARKAYDLVLKPILAVTAALGKGRTALVALGAAETIGPVKSAMVVIATKLGIITAEATAATVAIDALTAAELVNASTGGIGGASAGVAENALGRLARPQAKGIFGAEQVAANLRTQRFAGVDELAAGQKAAGARTAAKNSRAFGRITTGLEEAAPEAKTVAKFAKLESVFGKLAPVLGKVAGPLARLGAGFARFAGPIGLVVLAVEGAIGIFKGFFEEIKRGSGGTSEFGATIKELAPIAKAAFDILSGILGIVGDVGKSIGKVIGGAFREVIVILGDVIRGFKLLFQGDFIGFLKAMGDAIINLITAPFRLAIGLILDLVSNIIGAFDGIPGIGGKIKDLSDKVGGAAEQVRDFRVNMSQAAGETDTAAASAKNLSDQTLTAARSASELGLQQRLATQINAINAADAISTQRRLAAETQSALNTAGAAYGIQSASAVAAQNKIAASIETTRATTQHAITTTDLYNGALDSSATSTGRAVSATDLYTGSVNIMDGKLQGVIGTVQSLTSELYALQGAAQAGVGATDASLNSIIAAAEQHAADNPGLIPGFDASKQIRQRELIAAAKQSIEDQAVVDKALGRTPAKKIVTGTKVEPKAPKNKEFTDPNIAVQDSIDALKPRQKLLEVNRAIAKISKAGEKGYAATRRETLLLAEAVPTLDKAIQKQQKSVEGLDTALQNLRNTQLLGTKAITDAAFANDQAQKQLQLQRIDALAVAGTTEESPQIKAIDDQLKALQTQAERASLVADLQLDPLKKKLDETFNPTVELPFDEIVKQFQSLTAEQGKQQTALSAAQAQQELVNASLQTSQTNYSKIDAAASRAVDAQNKAAQAAYEASKGLGAAATSASTAATAVDSYSTAVESVPAGGEVVDKSLKGINARVAALSDQFSGAGKKIVTFLTQGINTARVGTLAPALARVVESIGLYLNLPASTDGIASRAGVAIMGGFLAGLKQGFGTPADVGSVAWYLNVFIPQWIRDNKGPVAYDATILVPAGNAIMEGFGSGIKSGFAQVQAFVKSVGPSLSEFVSSDVFDDRTAKYMVDVYTGKKPNADDVFGDLAPNPFDLGLGGFTGPLDPKLSFLHPSESLADTGRMAAQLAQLFGLQVTALRDNHSYLTASGNVSDHAKGLAADLSNSSGGGDNPASNTPQMAALAAALQPLFGTITKQVIYQNRDINQGFPVSGHQNHVHLAFKAAADFAADSGKFGKGITLPDVSGPVQGPVLARAVPGVPTDVAAALQAAAFRYQLPPALMFALAKQESGFRKNVVSGDGGYGLTQLTSPGLIAQADALGGRLDPKANTLVGAKYLHDLIAQLGSIPLGLSAYNSGPGGGERSGRIDVPNYVNSVLGFFDQFRKLFGGFREKGGPVDPRRSYVVGERGPEIFTPQARGGITNAQDSARIMAGGEGKRVTYIDNRKQEIHTAATDAEAILALAKAREAKGFTGVNLR